MENKKPEEGLQPDKEYISVEDWKTRPKPAYVAPHQQEGLKGYAAPPDNLADHFPPAQIREGRVGEILAWMRGEERRAPSPHLTLSLMKPPQAKAWALAAAADRHHRHSKSRLGWRTATPHSACCPRKIPHSQIRKNRYSSEQND